MKKLLIVIVLLCFVSKAESRVTRKDVKAAKAHYLAEKRPGLREIDSLYYLGLKQIRHDQKFWVIKVVDKRGI
jgi:hypothetical protein